MPAIKTRNCLGKVYFPPPQKKGSMSAWLVPLQVGRNSKRQAPQKKKKKRFLVLRGMKCIRLCSIVILRLEILGGVSSRPLRVH